MGLAAYSTSDVVHGGGLSQHVCSREHVGPSALEIVGNDARANGRSVQLLEYLKGLLPLTLVRNAGHEAVVVQVSHGGHRHSPDCHGAVHASAEVHPRQYVLHLGVQVPDGSSQPTLRSQVLGIAGVGDVPSAEVGPAGVRVSYALDDGHLPLVEHALDGGEVRVEAKPAVHGQHVFLGYLHDLAGIVVLRAGVGDEGVHEVVPAHKLDYNQDRRLAVAAAVALHALLLLRIDGRPAMRTGTPWWTR